MSPKIFRSKLLKQPFVVNYQYSNQLLQTVIISFNISLGYLCWYNLYMPVSAYIGHQAYLEIYLHFLNMGSGNKF